MLATPLQPPLVTLVVAGVDPLAKIDCVPAPRPNDWEEAAPEPSEEGAKANLSG